MRFRDPQDHMPANVTRRSTRISTKQNGKTDELHENLGLKHEKTGEKSQVAEEIQAHDSFWLGDFAFFALAAMLEWDGCSGLAGFPMSRFSASQIESMW